MKKQYLLRAERIHDGRHWLPEGSVLITDASGAVIDVTAEESAFAAATFYEGWLTPGFVNAHCHLELSHLRGLVPEKTRLIPFLQEVTRGRTKFSEEEKQVARMAALQEQVATGTVAIGDIANTADTRDLRAAGMLHFHTFVEAIGFDPATALPRLQAATAVYEGFEQQQRDTKILRQTLIPHAPYSVSKALFKAIDDFIPRALISIHNQESREEDRYYRQKTGGVKDLLQSFGIDDGSFLPSGKSSLQTYLPWLSPAHPLMLVHNTFTARADVQFAKAHAEQLFWCLCPNANLYIEDALPDVPMLQRESAVICIGTDSLASNRRLSVLSELQTLKKHFPELSWETLLLWACYNGACGLGMQHTVGSFAKGLTPGVMQIRNADSGTPELTRIQ